MISRGSEWRKWNLHMHSEYSRENRTKMKITEIFDSAVKNNISMISITDHSNFDALDEIWDIYQNGMCEQGHYSDIVDFLPGIELKTDKGKKGVHIISIFPKEIVVNRNTKQASIFNEKKKVIELYNKFKKPVDEFLRDKADLLSEYSISIRSGLVINEMFQEEVFSYINKQKKNAFRDDNYQLTKTVDALAEMDDIEQYIAIPNKIIKKMKDYDNENIVSSQLKDNKWLEFYNYLFGLQYIQNKYELVSDNKTLEKLSPGERGALLLIFYLLLDLRDIPLVIDQPEDNLDNQSVASILVPFIQAAKKRRQIILVTHNPNLAVVADSDQIVHVKINKEERNLVEVKSGGIENTEINDSIVTILEGTMLSFRKRDEKYIDK